MRSVALLIVPLVLLAGTSQALVSESREGLSWRSAASVTEKRAHTSASVQLPGGMDPEDVVRQVEKSWQRKARGRRDGDDLESTFVGESARLPAGGSFSRLWEPLAPAGDLGPTIEIGGVPVYGPAPKDQYHTKVAFNGTYYLVVWRDNRGGAYSDICGARVGTDGVVLDPGGIIISCALNNQDRPAVVSGGTEFLVVWEDERNGSFDIYGARVTADGVVLDATGIPISTGSDYEQCPDVSFDGTDYLVVWGDRRSGGWDIYGARVRVDGAVLDASGIAISTATYSQDLPVVEFDGSNYLVAWTDSRDGSLDIQGARVGVDGTVLDPGGIPISSADSSQSWPSVAFDGANYFVVWMDCRDGFFDIYGARVGVDGTVLDPSGIAISTGANDTGWPSVAFDGTNYLVAWGEYISGWWDVYGARVGGDGTVLDPGGMPVSTAVSAQCAPAVAFDGADYLVVWQDGRSNLDEDVYGARVGTDISILDPDGIAVSTALNDQETPSVAFDGTNYLVVWDDYRTGTSRDIYGARVGMDGSVLDPTGIVISDAADIQECPAVAFDGTNYLVVWDDYRSGTSLDIYGARVGTDGALLDPSGIAISALPDWQVLAAVAFDGANYLVVWDDYRSGTSWDIYGARVGTDGALLDPSGIAISTASDDQECPAVAFDGTDYLVVWHDKRSVWEYDIYGARVGVDGSVLDPAGIAISTAADNQECPAIAFDGTNYLVAWQDYRSAYYLHIYGTRVGTDGWVLDPIGTPISSADAFQQHPSIAFDGTNYFVVWQDIRLSGYDIYGARVDTCGVVLDTEGVLISAAEFNQLYPAVATDAAGALLVTYQSFEGPVVCGVDRVLGNFWQDQVGVPDGPGQLKFMAHQSYPNPFNPLCTIRYEIPNPGNVKLQIFDVTGSPVRTLVDTYRESGRYNEQWDGRGQDGGELPSGVYVYELEAGEFVATRKMVLLR